MKTGKFRNPTIYRDKKTGRFVSKSIWKRSKARGGTRYVRQRTKARRGIGPRINVLGFEGYVPVVVRSSKQRQLASRHLNAVGRFLRPPGDPEVLKPFVGKSVGGVELLTDPERLRELGKAEEIKLDAFYRQHRGARQEK